MNCFRRFRAALVLLLIAAPASAAVHAPRVVSPHNADAYSMKTFGDFDRWRNLRGDERAWEIYNYLVDTRTGVFHMNEVLEGSDPLSEYATVRDPVKIINVYGYGYCAIFGPFMAGVCEGAGVGPARSLILNDWRHVVAEAFYDNRWHYLDVDVRAVFRRPDGTLASFAEARRDKTLWTGRGPLFFPNDDLEHVRKIYESTPYYCHYGFHQTGHTMDYLLRQGETFTRWWTPQGGRWHHLPAYHQGDFMPRLIETPPRGPKPNHRHFTVHNHANGRFVYRPNLADGSSDLADGVYDCRNVAPGREGLVLAGPGKGYATFEVRTPYVIVPKVNRPETTDDDCEASVVEIDATGASLSISLDGGISWQPIPAGPVAGKFDLTGRVAGRYGYLLRVDLEGQDTARVRRLQITTWVQVAPAALPSLRAGRNRMEFRINDHYGLPSRVAAVCSDTSRPDELRKHVVEMPDDYDPDRRTERIRGQVIAKVEPPPGTKIAWFTAEGSFRTHQREAASKTRNTIAYATEGPENFEEIYRSEMPTDMEHWHYNAAREIRLESPAKTLFVRYLGDPAVNNFRVYAHCVQDKPRPASPVVITHTWTDGGERKTRRVELAGPGEYEIEAGSAPLDESIEIAVLSDAANQEAEKPSEPSSGGLPDWVEPMRGVHARFSGERGTFAQFGDSITDSRAFWTSLKWKRTNPPPEMTADFELVSRHMLDDCWDRKGAEYGNQGGQTIRWAWQNLDGWLHRWNPEAAILMFGTNDLNNVGVEDYEATLEKVVERCLDHGTVVILSTIPPRHGREAKAAEFADAARRVAARLRVPLTDLHAEMLRRRPDDWDGALEKFRNWQGYDVPTLIARDGVHPSNPQQYQADYSEEALRSNGFSLRNYLVLKAYAEVIRNVLSPQQPAANPKPPRPAP